MMSRSVAERPVKSGDRVRLRLARLRLARPDDTAASPELPCRRAEVGA